MKYHTILVQVNQRFDPLFHPLSTKLEISLRDVLAKAEIELGLLRSSLDYPLLTFFTEKRGVILADKVAAILLRKKARDLYDLLFLLTKKTALDIKRVENICQRKYTDEKELWKEVITRIQSFSPKEINADLGPFLSQKERELLKSLKIQLQRTIEGLVPLAE